MHKLLSNLQKQFNLDLTRKDKYKIYGELVYQWVTKGRHDKELHMDKSSVQIYYNRIRSVNYSNFYYSVTSFPSSIPFALEEEIRKEISNKFDYQIFVDFITIMEPHRIRWKSTSMSNSLFIWRLQNRRIKEQVEQAEDDGFANWDVSNNDLNNNWLKNSWEHFKECDANGIATPIVTSIIRLRVPTKEVKYLKILEKTLYDAFDGLEIGIKPINFYLFELLKFITPLSVEVTKLARRFISSRVLTSDITGSMLSQKQGSTKQGNLIVGHDIENRLEVSLDYSAEIKGNTNTIIFAPTGGGKSFIIKYISEQVPAMPSYLYLTDFESNEYKALGDKYGAVYIDLRGRSGKYFECLRLQEPTGIPIIDETIYTDAINGAYAQISAIMGAPLTKGQLKLLSDAIEQVFASHEVREDDMSTYKNSKDITIKEIYPKLSYLLYSKAYSDSYGTELRDLVDALYTAFKGTYKYLFMNPIGIDEIKDERIVITRFGDSSSGSGTTGQGNAEKNNLNNSNIEMRLKQLTKLQVDQRLSKYRRIKNQSFVIVEEEIPRFIQTPGVKEQLEANWLAVRKYNGACIGVINDPQKIANLASTLITNSRYIIVGRTTDLNSLEYFKSVTQLSNSIDLIKSLDNYENAFLLCYDNVKTIFRAELPRVMVESPIYQTKSEEYKY